ncbi:unnamed protein product [Colias eurytheme]|nr:unnamed protein product [Colias eurytheme]
MNSQVAIFLCLIIAFASALPSEQEHRVKRDVMDGVKNAWDGAVQSAGEASDAVVNAVKPTEKSVIDKVADGVKDLGQ